jgi:hypothetical protein
MTINEALEAVVARTGVERYRYLCLEHPKPTLRAEYTSLVLRLAAQPPSSRPTPTELVALARKVMECPFRSTELSGCGCAHCGLRSGARVSKLECVECMRNYP